MRKFKNWVEFEYDGIMYKALYEFESGMKSNDYHVPDDPDEVRLIEIINAMGRDFLGTDVKLDMFATQMCAEDAYN